MKPRRLTVEQLRSLGVDNVHEFMRRGCFWLTFHSGTWHLVIPSYPNPANPLRRTWPLFGTTRAKFEPELLRPEIEKILQAATHPFPWPELWTPVLGVKVPKVYFDKNMAHWVDVYDEKNKGS
jgi:hypothetical protein